VVFFSCYISPIFRVVCESEEIYDATSNSLDSIMKAKIIQSTQLESNNLKSRN